MTEKALREALDRADHLASVQAQAIAALEQLATELRAHNQTLQDFAAAQQQEIQRLMSLGS